MESPSTSSLLRDSDPEKGEYYPLPREYLATGLVGIFLYTILAILSFQSLLRFGKNRSKSTRRFFMAIGLMAIFELPRFFSLAIDEDYISRSTYSCHIIAGICFFLGFSIVCRQWSGLLTLGSTKKYAIYDMVNNTTLTSSTLPTTSYGDGDGGFMSTISLCCHTVSARCQIIYFHAIYSVKSLIISNTLFAIIDIIAIITCLGSRSLKGYFFSSSFEAITLLEGLRNLLYAIFLTYFGIKLVKRFWHFSVVEQHRANGGSTITGSTNSDNNRMKTRYRSIVSKGKRIGGQAGVWIKKIFSLEEEKQRERESERGVSMSEDVTHTTGPPSIAMTPSTINGSPSRPTKGGTALTVPSDQLVEFARLDEDSPSPSPVKPVKSEKPIGIDSDEDEDIEVYDFEKRRREREGRIQGIGSHTHTHNNSTTTWWQWLTNRLPFSRSGTQGQGNGQTMQGQTPAQGPQQQVFTKVVNRLTLVLSLVTICFLFRLIMLLTKLIIIVSDSSNSNNDDNQTHRGGSDELSSRTFTIFGLLWFLCSDFIPRALPCFALVLLMRTTKKPSKERIVMTKRERQKQRNRRRERLREKEQEKAQKKNEEMMNNGKQTNRGMATRVKRKAKSMYSSVSRLLFGKSNVRTTHGRGDNVNNSNKSVFQFVRLSQRDEDGIEGEDEEDDEDYLDDGDSDGDDDGNEEIVFSNHHQYGKSNATNSHTTGLALSPLHSPTRDRHVLTSLDTDLQDKVSKVEKLLPSGHYYEQDAVYGIDDDYEEGVEHGGGYYDGGGSGGYRGPSVMDVIGRGEYNDNDAEEVVSFSTMHSSFHDNLSDYSEEEDDDDDEDNLGEAAMDKLFSLISNSTLGR